MDTEALSSNLRNLPGVDVLMNHPEVKSLKERFAFDVVAFFVKQTIDETRQGVLSGLAMPSRDKLVEIVKGKIEDLAKKNLKPVINASGVIIHTNLGRAPFGDLLLDDVRDVLRSYNNLEFDLEKATRGSRHTHVTELLRFLTGAEDILVVNNNAAAVMLVLGAFAKNRQVIISRGELIEIGGSFRLPDIMAASGCEMVEVGTTNKTRIKDYEREINPSTAILLKAHHSNYVIRGFSEEASLDELVALGRQKNVMVVYDMGSGLLRKASVKMLANEPDVKSTLARGIDLVTFSGDKLLGGPQAGIIAGSKDLIARLKKEPMTRAIRVGKTTLAMLESICLAYLDEKSLLDKSPVFKMLNAGSDELEIKASGFQKILLTKGVKTSVIKSEGQAGGGSLPEDRIESFAVKIELAGSRKEKTGLAEKIYYRLLKVEHPVLGILRK
nr:L-seryl-tRNA(Sec) selenium transferase [Bacteroidota bacterium]